jgi:hypothetical protein
MKPPKKPHLALVILLTVFPLSAQQPSINIEVRGQTYTLELPKPVPLNAVLDEICSRSGAHCEGTQNASSIMAVPGKTSGDWGTLVGKMLEGTKLNYVASAPWHGGPGQLVISLAPSGNLEVATPGQPAAHPAGNDQGSYEATVSGLTQGRPSPVMTGDDVSGQSTAHNGQQTGFAPALSNWTGQTAAAVESKPGVFLRDANGQAVSASGEPTRYLPIPDSQGRPIPVAPVSGGVLPFPDAHGNPIPLQPQQEVTFPFPIHPQQPN